MSVEQKRPWNYVPTDTEAILDHIRQQVRAEFARTEQQRVEEEGLRGVRHTLGMALEKAEMMDDFPTILHDAIALAYNLCFLDEFRDPTGTSL